MGKQIIKQVVEVDPEFISRVENALEEIKLGMKSLKAVPYREYLTPDEFRERCKISLFKYKEMLADGILEHKRIGPRKIYIPAKEVERYFAGELVAS